MGEIVLSIFTADESNESKAYINKEKRIRHRRVKQL